MQGSSKEHKSEASEKVVSTHDLNRKPRFKWTVELHEHFVKAVNELGGPYEATPKNIMKFMDDEDITTEHIKSHLQVIDEAIQKENLENKEKQEMHTDATASIELQAKEESSSSTLKGGDNDKGDDNKLKNY